MADTGTCNASTDAPITLDFNCMMAEFVGPEHGIEEADLEALAPKVAEFGRQLADERAAGELPFMDLPYQTESADHVEELADSLRESSDAVVVFGIGGSALGTIALQTALLHPYHNLLPAAERAGPRIFVLDNIDPVQFEGLVSIVPFDRTIFNVISKSGSTAETMAQFLIIRERLRAALGDGFRDRIILTTDLENGVLRRLCRKEGYRSLVAPDGVGGRFSVLSPVGLFPAAMAGIDIRQLLAGAAAMDERCRSCDLWRNPAFMNAALQYLAATKKQKPLSVVMPYAYALRDVADWYRQLWAESLGKRLDLAGRVVNCGPTPIRALGVTDQHSQVQLYLEGPYDKVVTFLSCTEFASAVKIPPELDKEEGVGYLCGHTLNELLGVELQGTRIALTEAKRPNATIELPQVNAHSVGQLLYLFEVQTAMCGKLYGINAFDQPGVEAGKTAACALLGRKGYETKREEIAGARPRLKRYVT